MEDKRRYLVTVKTIEGNILKFKTSEFTVDGGHVVFEDNSGFTKRFPFSRTDIEEVES